MVKLMRKLLMIQIEKNHNLNRKKWWKLHSQTKIPGYETPTQNYKFTSADVKVFSIQRLRRGIAIGLKKGRNNLSNLYRECNERVNGAISICPVPQKCVFQGRPHQVFNYVENTVEWFSTYKHFPDFIRIIAHAVKNNVFIQCISR